MASTTHILIVAAYSLGILTSAYWHWTSFTLPSSCLTKSNAVSISFDQNTRFGKMQIGQVMSSNIPYELQNNLIMGAATNISLKNLYRFTRSARLSCNKCTIVLLVHNDTAQTDDLRLLASVFELTLIIYESFSSKPTEKAFHFMAINTQRWIIFYDYVQSLLEAGKRFDNVFFCDVRDSIFQTDVFAHMNARGDGLYTFMEDVNISIAKEAVNTYWINVCYGQQMLEAIGNKSISCSGTVLGSWSAIVAYLSIMKSQFLSRSEFCLCCVGNDQGIHNVIIHNAMVPNTTIYHIAHETGFVGTLGLPTWLKRNKFGLILNANMEIYAVVHQIDRSPQLLSQFDREYQILPDNILNKKL